MTGILKDLDAKLDSIKSDTELLEEYGYLIETMFDKTWDIEAYLKRHLATDWERIKDTWKAYKAGSIDKKEVVKRAIKGLGKNFIKVMIYGRRT